MNITTQIQGGLGNQLFQYAAGKALSLRLKRSLLLDISWFNHGLKDVTPRYFLLPELQLHYQLSSTTTIRTSNLWRRIAQQLIPLNPYVLNERPYHFDKKLNDFKPYTNQNVILRGYWQSFRYFQSIRNELIQEIRPVSDISGCYQEYLGQIRDSLSAMVHIRRGDYVHLPAAAKVHGFLGLEYYQKGMELLLAKDPYTQFFIFSDDIEWAKANLPHQNRSTFIQGGGEKTAPIQELFLMTQCKKHLIANSSLSWWGAWLCTNPNPQVIAPVMWTNDPKKNWGDLLPSDWQRI